MGKCWKDIMIFLPSFFMIAAVIFVVSNSTGDIQKKQSDKMEQEQAVFSEEIDKNRESGYADGSYRGSGQGFGGPVKAEVTIQEGNISKIDILSYKKESKRFFRKAKELIEKIVKEQSIDVDVVSGATYSSYGIIDAVAEALEKAAGNDAGNKEQAQQDLQKEAMTEVADGTFKGSAVCKVFQYTVQLQVTFKNGYITKIHHLKVKDNRNPANKSFWKRAYRMLKKSMIEEQSAEVDAVSGATFVSTAIKEAYEMAYQKAVKAKEKEEKGR